MNIATNRASGFSPNEVQIVFSIFAFPCSLKPKTQKIVPHLIKKSYTYGQDTYGQDTSRQVYRLDCPQLDAGKVAPAVLTSEKKRNLYSGINTARSHSHPIADEPYI